jgi:hypothetical protein
MRNDLLGLAKQATKGTGVFTAEYYVPVEQANGSPQIEQIEIVETLGKRFPSDPPDKGSSTYEVSAQGACRPAALPRLLSGFMGDPTTTTPGGATTSRQHAFDMWAADTSLRLHSILVGRADPNPKITDWFYDMYGSSLTLSVAPNDYLKFDAQWAGRLLNVAQTFPVAPSSDATQKFTYSTVKAYITVGAGAEAEVKCGEASITIANEIDLDYLALGAQDAYDIGVGNGSCEVSFTPLESLDVWYRRQNPTNADDIKLRLIAEGATLEGSIKNTIEVTVHRARVTSADAPINAGEILKGVPVTLQAAKHPSLAKFVDARVINAVASY